MSSSTEEFTGARGVPGAPGATASHVLRGHAASSATALPTPELRDGAWTRFGTGAVLGDAVTEQALSGLAESTRHAARAQGYAVGWAEGRRAAAEAAMVEAAEAHTALATEDRRRELAHQEQVQALARAAADFHEATRAVAADLEDQALRLARELTELMLGRELARAADPTADVVRRVLAVLPDGAAATVHLHPDTASALAGSAPFGPGVAVVADPTSGRDDARVETDQQVVDLAVSTALQRVREALS